MVLNDIVPANGYRFQEYCRNCNHNNAWHVDGHYNEIVIPCEAVLDIDCKKTCKCANFVPKDNLKYLELMSDKRS